MLKERPPKNYRKRQPIAVLLIVAAQRRRVQRGTFMGKQGMEQQASWIKRHARHVSLTFAAIGFAAMMGALGGAEEVKGPFIWTALSCGLVCMASENIRRRNGKHH